MRWYQDTRGFDSLYSDGEGSLLAGAAGNFYGLGAYGGEGTNDNGSAIVYTWISKFHDQRAPNNDKTYQDLVIDHDTQGNILTVKALLDNGYTVLTLGTIQSVIRTQTPFQIGDELGRQGKNCAVMIQGSRLDIAGDPKIYAAFYHYYIEARGALTWDSDEQDAGTQQVKAMRAVELDLNNPAEVTVYLYTDMPGSAMTVRSTKIVPLSTTRRKYTVEFPRPYIEGRHYRVIVESTGGTVEFQLYGARIELQPFGEYVEGYQSTAGREWNSGTLDLGTPKVKEVREAQLDLDTDGALTFEFNSELPGLSMTARSTKTVNTELTTTGRRMFNLPLLADGIPVEGRLVQCFLRGTTAWRLYGAWLFARPIGYYVEAYQALDGHIWDSTVLDLGTQQVKRLHQLWFEAHADSPLTVKTYTSNAAGDMVLRNTQTLAGSTSRHPYTVQLPAGIYGRLVRVTISSTAAFRLFHARMFVKPIGVYLNGGTTEHFPVEAEQDVGTERVKLFKEIELVYSSAGAGVARFYTDLPNGDVQAVRSWPLATTTGTETVKLHLPGSAKGRLIRMAFEVGTGDLQLFQARLWARVVGESGKAQWSWIPLPIPQTPDNYTWADLYVAPTPPAWEWMPIYVPPTQTEKWNWLDLPVEL